MLVVLSINKRLIPIFLLLGISSSLGAQTKVQKVVLGDSLMASAYQVVLTGTITNAATGQPVSGAHIHVQGILAGTADEQGKYFVLMNPGNNRLAIRHVSMQAQIFDLYVFQTSVFDVGMDERVFELEEIVVHSEETDANVKQVMVGSAVLKASDIRVMPALVGEPDVIKSLQYLPGVTSVGEGSSGFNVRGGRTDQNLTLINDAILLGTNHAIGFLSPYNSDAVEDFTLFKGNIPSAYGGRIASTLNVQMRNGNAERWSLQLTPGTSTSKVLVEGPLVKGKISFLSGGRISNTNWLLNEVKDSNVRSSSVQFDDTYSSIYFKLGSKSNLLLNLLTTGDYFRFSDQYGYQWSSLLASTTFKYLLSDNASIVTLVAFGNTKNSFFDLRPAQSAQLSNGVSYTQVKSSFSKTFKNNTLQTGIEAVLYEGLPEILKFVGNSNPPRQVNKSAGVEASLFASYDFNPVEWFSLNAGIRYSSFLRPKSERQYLYRSNGSRSVSSIFDTTVVAPRWLYDGMEPRFSARFSLSRDKSIKLGYSRIFQYLHSISNTTSPTPTDSWQVSTQYIKPQQSDNFSVGYFQNLKDNLWSFSSEVFYRETKNQLEYKDFASLNVNDHIETELIGADGRAYGAEIQMKKNRGRWTGWVSYTFSRALARTVGGEDQINDGNWFAANYDRPHSASLVLNRKFRNHGSFNCTFIYTSGRPVSIINAYYSVNGTVVPNYTNRNEYRIPDYFRLDVSFRVANIIKKIEDSLTIGVFNLLGFSNAYSVYYSRLQNQSELQANKLALIGSPIPSITYSVTIK